MKLTLSIWNKYLLGITFLLSYFNTISARIDWNKKIDWYTFTPEAPISGLINAIIVYAILNFFLSRKNEIIVPKVNWVQLSSVIAKGLFIYILVSNVLSYGVAFAFDTIARNYASIEQQISINIDHLVDYFLYTTIFIAYLFYTKNIQQEQHLKKVEQSLNESTITNLRAQLNPHFLFNNLNSLDELIHVDKDRASDFLADFANLYRFCLEKSDQHLIPLDDELDFAKSYFDMMEQKYPNEYLLSIHAQHTANLWIPPFTCQTLIENVIEHNRPQKGEAIQITLTLQGNQLTIVNDLSGATRKEIESGKALKNLETQFELLAGKPLTVKENNHQFEVQIPLIEK